MHHTFFLALFFLSPIFVHAEPDKLRADVHSFFNSVPTAHKEHDTAFARAQATVNVDKENLKNFIKKNAYTVGMGYLFWGYLKINAWVAREGLAIDRPKYVEQFRDLAEQAFQTYENDRGCEIQHEAVNFVVNEESGQLESDDGYASDSDRTWDDQMDLEAFRIKKLKKTYDKNCKNDPNNEEVEKAYKKWQGAKRQDKEFRTPQQTYLKSHAEFIAYVIAEQWAVDFVQGEWSKIDHPLIPMVEDTIDKMTRRAVLKLYTCGQAPYWSINQVAASIFTDLAYAQGKKGIEKIMGKPIACPTGVIPQCVRNHLFNEADVEYGAKQGIKYYLWSYMDSLFGVEYDPVVLF